MSNTGTAGGTFSESSSPSVSSSVSASPSQTPSCQPPCANGVCLGTTCQCQAGFTGSACDAYTPLYISGCTTGCTQYLAGGTEVTLQGVGLFVPVTARKRDTTGLSLALRHIAPDRLTADRSALLARAGNPTLAGTPTVNVYFDNRLMAISSAAADGSQIKFVPPAVLHIGYQNITLIDNLNGQVVTQSNFLYFDISCLDPGVVRINGECVSCPEGAVCPGGARMWPIAGYWSANEQSVPAKCTLEFTCPGSLSAGNHADGTRVTDNCDTGAGYTGAYCSQCAAGWYRDNFRCRSCDADTLKPTKNVDFSVLAFVGAALIALLCLGAVFLNTKRLNLLVSLICVFQQLIYAGRNASKFIDGPAGEKIGDVFRSMSILLLDVEFVKPACALPSITFAQVYWGTLVVFIIAGFCLTGASVLHAFFQRRGTCCRKTSMKMKPAGFCFYFLSRFQYCLIVLAAIVYLQLNIRIFQAIDCVKVGDKWLLGVELHTECYTGDHLGPGVLSWFLLFFYSILFPVALLISLTMAARQHRLREFDQSKFAYVMSGVRIKFFWFKASSILSTFVLAANGVFIHDSAALIFAGGTSFLFNFVLGGFVWPYIGLMQNGITLLVGLFAWIQLVIYLKLLPNLKLHYIGLGIGLFFVILVAIVRYKEIRDFVKKGNKLTAYTVCGDCCNKDKKLSSSGSGTNKKKKVRPRVYGEDGFDNSGSVVTFPYSTGTLSYDSNPLGYKDDYRTLATYIDSERTSTTACSGSTLSEYSDAATDDDTRTETGLSTSATDASATCTGSSTA